MKTIIVGAVQGYDWKKIEPWLRSLRLTGFDGDVHLLIYGYSRSSSALARISRFAQRAGVILHECTMTAKQVVVSRFNDLAKLCVTFNEQAWVIFPDVGDIVFQKNPDEFLGRIEKDKRIVVASEGVRFSGNRWVRENLENSFPEHYDAMIGETLYNAGSAAAKAGTWMKLAADVYWMSMAKAHASSHDQAAMNILLRDDRYRDYVLFTRANDGWCFNGASSMFAKTDDRVNYLERWPELIDGKCYVEAGLAVMFHHYTRDAGTKARVLRRLESGTW